MGILTRSAEARAGGPIIYASAYGAKGEGTTDNTKAFTQAIAAAATVGGTVMLSSGTYSIGSSMLVLTGDVSFDLNGATISQTGTGAVFQCNPTNYDNGLTGPAYQLNIPANNPPETNFIYFTRRLSF